MTEKEREKQAAEPWNEITADQTDGRDPAEICEANAELFTMRRNYAANVAGRFGAALDEIEKAEKETLQAATVRGEKILALFELEPPDALHKTLTQTQNYTAAAWYRAANKNFTAGNYAAALDVFIDNETAAAISPKIDSVKKQFALDHGGRKMTLARFLSRFAPRSDEPGPDDGGAAAYPTTQKSYFDNVINSGLQPFFAGNMVTYSAQQIAALAQVNTNKLETADDGRIFQITPANITYYFNMLSNGSAPNIGTPELKLITAAVYGVTQKNTHKTAPKNVVTTVKIPLIEYGEQIRTVDEIKKQPQYYTPRKMETAADQIAENKRVEKRLERLRVSIRRQLENLEAVKIPVPNQRTKNGQYEYIQFIGKHAIKTIDGTEYICIEFLQSAVISLVNWNKMSILYPELLRLDNRSYNAFPLGLKIALQANIDNNVIAGNDQTITVKKALENMPHLPKYNEIKKSNCRSWKIRIKDPYENNWDQLKNSGFLLSWTYRDARTGVSMTPEQAGRLEFKDWENLRMDYELKTDHPENDERRKKRIAERAAAAKAAAEKEGKTATRKKRGRPKKETK